MIRLLNVALGLAALWLAVLLLAGELGGWTYLLLLGAVGCSTVAIALAVRRQISLRSERGRAEYR